MPLLIRVNNLSLARKPVQFMYYAPVPSVNVIVPSFGRVWVPSLLATVSRRYRDPLLLATMYWLCDPCTVTSPEGVDGPEGVGGGGVEPEVLPVAVNVRDDRHVRDRRRSCLTTEYQNVTVARIPAMTAVSNGLLLPLLGILAPGLTTTCKSGCNVHQGAT
jgi:hypothetical protein